MKFQNSIYKFFISTLIIFSILLIFIVSGYFGLRLIYPQKYVNEVEEYSKRYNVESETVFAIIKCESGFKKSAVSIKSAKGLMQLTDSTARFIADRIGLETFDLFLPSDNIMLGTCYFSYLLNKFVFMETALAAYNAGEGNVSLWLKDSRYSSNGKTLYKIPFKETAKYVKSVACARKFYKSLYFN